MMNFCFFLIFLLQSKYIYSSSSKIFSQSLHKKEYLNIINKNKFFHKQYALKKLKNLEEKNKNKLSDDIIILFTNDVHCRIMENIGYDGLSLYKKELKKKYKTVLTVDTGDAIQGGAIGLLSKGVDIINIMNLVGYDVANLGNHEFDYGVEQLKKLSNILNCNYICANCCYLKNKTSLFPPYKIITIDSERKIAFIGIDTPQTISKTILNSFLDEDGKLVYDFLTGNNGIELFDTIQNYINEVRLKGANYVVILAHLGNGRDPMEWYTSDNLISHITGVDLLLDGHSHLVYNSFSLDKNGNKVPIIQTGDKLQNVGIIKLIKNGKILTEIISEIPEPLIEENALLVKRKHKERWIDLEMKNKLEDIIHQYDDILNEIIGYSNLDFFINESRLDECTLCNIIVDAIRYVGNADCSLINAGTVRNNIYKGTITYNNLLDVLPFYGYIFIKEVKGIDILDALEFGVSNLPNMAQKFPQVSGITFDVDTSIKSTVEIDENGLFVKVKGKRRVSGVLINGVKLDLEKKYKISLTDFISNGGDGYSMFSKYDVIYDTLKSDNQAFYLYLQKFNGTIPDFYKVKQGRIVIDSKENFDIFFYKLYKN